MKTPIKNTSMLSPEEKKVIQICLIYQEEFDKLFNGKDSLISKGNKLKNSGDQRNCVLFKNCWKFNRETRGILPDEQHRNYIKANLIITNLFKKPINPTCITGDKAWMRYMVWKRKYDIKLLEINASLTFKGETPNPKIYSELDKTKKFLFEKFNGEIPNIEKMQEFLDKGYLNIWVATNKISPYYLVLSPIIKKLNCLESLIINTSATSDLYLSHLDDRIFNYFKHEYKYEFSRLD